MVRLVWVLAGVVALAGCDNAVRENGEPVETPVVEETTVAVAEEPVPEDEESPAPLPEPSGDGSRDVEEETELFLFEYAYPKAAGRIPPLAALLERRLDERRTELTTTAREARRQARADGFPYNKHSYTADWKVVTDLPRWLSLSNEWTTYTGGAHGMYGMDSLVWDKEEGKALLPIQLFTSPAALGEALGERFCDELDRQRAEKRGEAEDELNAMDGTFTDCPGIEEATVLVGSRSGRRLDRLTLYLGPYVAGPYAEGAYEVNLRVDDAVIEAVKPEYRASFASRN